MSELLPRRPLDASNVVWPIILLSSNEIKYQIEGNSFPIGKYRKKKILLFNVYIQILYLVCLQNSIKINVKTSDLNPSVMCTSKSQT